MMSESMPAAKDDHAPNDYDSIPARLEAELAEYLQRREADADFDEEAWLASHPTHAAQLRSFIANHRQMDQRLKPIKNSLDDSTSTNLHSSRSRSNPPFPLLREHDFVDQVVGDYQLLNEIARGGMGRVFRARQVSLGRIVAIKMTLGSRFGSTESEARFRLEAQSAASLDHPHIVPIYEIGEVDGYCYYSMKYIEGSSLVVFRSGELRQQMTPERAVRILALVAQSRSPRASAWNTASRYQARQYLDRCARLSPTSPTLASPNVLTERAISRSRMPYWEPPAIWRRSKPKGTSN